jgi:flagellar basal body-associated protein FliL
MAKKKKGDEEAEGGKKGGKGKKLIPVVLLLVGLVAGKMFFAPKKTPEQIKAAKAAAERKLAEDCAAANDVKLPAMKPKAGQTTTTTTTAAPAPSKANGVLEEDPVTVNLADGHYLKVGVAMQLQAGDVVTDAKDNGLGAKALDMAIAALSAKTMNQLSNEMIRTDLKHKLGYEVCKAYEGEITTVYFTNFVMQ